MFSFIRALFGDCGHYFVKVDGVWTCTMCGATR
jgi:hypothetical protein